MISMGEYNQMDYTTKNLSEKIVGLINSSNRVYAFRTRNHLLKKNSLISWIEKCQELKRIDSVPINFQNSEKKSLESLDEEGVLLIDITLENIKDFIDRFYLSINSIKSNVDFYSDSSTMFVDDPLYDQYDFLFTNGDHAILLTDIHSGIYIVFDNLAN